MTERRHTLPTDPDEQRRYFETLIEVSPTAIVTTDPDLVVTSWNPAAESLFGYAVNEAVGRPVNDLVARNEAVLDEARSLDKQVVVGPISRLTRRTRKDGSLVDVAVRGAPITLDGRLVGAYALYEDVSELVRQRRFFESLVEVSPTAIVMVDRDTRVTRWNPAAEELFGHTASEAIGRYIDDLVADHPEVREEALAYSAEAWDVEVFHRFARRARKDGTLVDVEIKAARVLLEDEAIGYYILYHDISELAQARRQLERRVDEQMAELVRTGELAHFLPRQVAQALLAGRLAPDEGFERRRITVLFADMVGFTDLAESLEPEELAEVVNGYLRQMSAAILAHGGTVANFMGDGVMALFGAPEPMAEAEQAWSAVQTAVEMRDACRKLGADLRGRGIPADVDIRVGVNTGHCTIGVFGSEVMRSYNAVGFAVNVAARLEAAADPGSILCGFRTFALIQERIDARQREPLWVKGSRRPVEAWELVRVNET
jgi:PAS domain S-box-containing protein